MNPYAPPATAPQQPSGYQGGPRPAQSGPGTGLMILGVVNMIFGALGLLSLPLVFVTKSLARDPVSRRIQELTWEGGMGIWMRTSLFLGAIMACALIASGYGIMKLKPWARKVSIGYALAAILMAILGQIMSAMFLYPVLTEMLSQGSGDPVKTAGAMGGLVGGIIGGAFALVLPVIILIVMNRASVKEKFANA
jgi:hypothetical protein